ncbi:MAG: outer membrane protein transport protein [Proteobacteria bacterium]|nr:outer membrane protein transport protein [Pseudomonadota bacterium]
MKKQSLARRTLVLAAAAALVLAFSTPAMATNGDNLIAIGPIARAMGGVGVANPQDAISAVFSNPAAMCFGDYCPSTQVDFAGTLFMPKVKTSITNGGQVFSADSEDKVYSIPAIGLSVPIGEGSNNWRFGLAACGVSGLGVDYRGTDVDRPAHYPFPGGPFPMISGEYTELQIMKFAPALAVQPLEQWSFGAALHIDYAMLDLRNGGSAGYGMGIQLGTIFRPSDMISLGLSYISPQSVDHDNVQDFDGDGTLDSLELQSPQQVVFGAALAPWGESVLFETDLKWINWESAAGYEDFDWENQWVLGLGVQVRPIPELALRCGYNYGNNPVKEHDNFNGTLNVDVQGKTMPAYYYETFRVTGFPAILQHHLTLGVGWDISPRFSLSLGYMYGFEETITESGTDFTGQPVLISSSLSESSLDFGLAWKF